MVGNKQVAECYAYKKIRKIAETVGKMTLILLTNMFNFQAINIFVSSCVILDSVKYPTKQNTAQENSTKLNCKKEVHKR